ncbi:unnamed protein product [Rangifer tarandus platyrhynchus]|uniref:Uncharacterized protein n=2 Tax=Rangifer tarandus platyrhynchus TaxID=3082113 RepID=A0ABN8Z654_RANTA|nr:unnamed protein product [Rangifer tarandus platyrhynchus]
METPVESGLQTSKPPKSSSMSSIQRSPNYPEYSLFEKEVTIFGSRWLWMWAILLSGGRDSLVPCSFVQVLLTKCPCDCALKSQGSFTHHIKSPWVTQRGNLIPHMSVSPTPLITFQVGACGFPLTPGL